MARSRNLGYGEGSLYFENGRWRGELRLNGKRRRVSDPNRSEALRKLDKLRAQVEAGLPLGDDVRLGTWLDWFVDMIVSQKDPNTRSNYEWAIGHLKPLRGKRLRELDVADVESLLRDLAMGSHVHAADGRGGRTRPLGKSSVTRIKTVLGAALAEAERLDKVGRNVARLARVPKEAAPPRPRRSLNSEEARKLVYAIENQRNGPLMSVHLTMGLRPGEITGLPWNAVDLKAGTMQIHQSLKRLPTGSLVIGGTKAKSDRTLRLPTNIIDVLRLHRTVQTKERLSSPVWEDHGLVFTNSIGRPIDFSNLRRIVKRFATSAGLGHLSPNELRHSATSLLVDAGTPIHDVSDMLGHADIRMLAQTYRHKIRPIVDVTNGQDRMLLG